MRRLALLGAAAVVYSLGAWLVAPGFFDGLAPAAPYRWVSPPPDLRSSNQGPTSGRTTIAVQGGLAQGGHLLTPDQQAAITFPSQSFQVPAGGSPIVLEIKPVATYPSLGSIVPAGNVYLISASTRLTGPVVVTLRYGSQQFGPPSQLFTAPSSAGPWRSLTAIASAVPYTVAASTQTLGYFMVGFARAPAPSQSAGAASAAGLPVPLIVAGAAVVLAVLAAIPFIIGRRGAAETEPQVPATPSRPAAPKPERPQKTDVEARPAPGQNLGGSRRRRRQGRR